MYCVCDGSCFFTLITFVEQVYDEKLESVIGEISSVKNVFYKEYTHRYRR